MNTSRDNAWQDARARDVAAERRDAMRYDDRWPLAPVHLFPTITPEVCRRYITQARAETNAVSAQIRAISP